MPEAPVPRPIQRRLLNLALVCASLFTLLALDVHFGGLAARMDTAAARWVAETISPHQRDMFQDVVSLPGDTVVAVLLAIVGGVALASRRRAVWGLAFACHIPINHAAVRLLKEAFARPRPEGADLAQFAFPSGHAAAAAMWLVFVAFWNWPRLWEGQGRWMWAVAGSLVAATALGRVLGGVHYPSDVAAGILLTITTGSLVLLAIDRWAPHRRPGA